MPEDNEMQLERSAAKRDAESQDRGHVAAARAKQKELIKAMTPQQRLDIAFDMRRTAMELKKAYLEKTHPDWTEQQVQAEVRRIFLYART